MKKYYVAYEKNGTKKQTPKFMNRECAKHLANTILRSGIPTVKIITCEGAKVRRLSTQKPIANNANNSNGRHIRRPYERARYYEMVQGLHDRRSGQEDVS